MDTDETFPIMDSVMDWQNLEHFFEKYILTDTKQEEIKDVIKELLICLEQNNTEFKEVAMTPWFSEALRPDGVASENIPEEPVDLTFKPQIYNVLSTARLGCKLDLNFIVRNTWNCEFNPKTFPAITIRIRKPRSTARLFRNGTLVCAGAKSIDESHRAARKFARIVQKLNFPVRLLNFQIKNILCCGNFFPVHLADVYQAYYKKCSYNPELFPSLFFHGVPGITATISPKGNIILNGPRSTEEIHKASEAISLILSPFRKHEN